MLGVNLAGAEFGEALPGVYNQDYTYPGVAQLNYYKARGLELIRLPFKWERLQRTLNGPLDSAELARIDTFLNLAEARGMRVILDMHNYGRYKISGTNYIIGSPEVPRDAFRDVWERIAAHVKDRDCIWAYGIMNEPQGRLFCSSQCCCIESTAQMQNVRKGGELGESDSPRPLRLTRCPRTHP
jgi:aryl-phospho-beta-D-glucosidase BglC (GH1 family)